MYPFLRMAWQVWRHRGRPLAPFGTHVSRHLCWPWDIDVFWELNNGRALTLYDLGRVPWSRRIGFAQALRAEGCAIAVAGASVRYRRRVRAFALIEMRTRAMGWDERFMYSEQSMWVRGECAGHVLIRSAATAGKGIVPPARLMAAMGVNGPSPPLPTWVRAWIEADAARPWPPMEEA